MSKTETKLRSVVYYASKEGGPAPSPGLMVPVVTLDTVSSFGKPRIGGLWTSPVDVEYPWAEWCRENEMTHWLREGYVLSVAGEPRLLVIDSATDLHNAWLSYGRASAFGDALQFAQRDLNYEAIAADYDAIWLTTRGHFDTRLGLELNTYAWDCETVLWFRWCFESVTPLLDRDQETG